MIEVRPYILGTKITEPGIYSGVPIRLYHGYRDIDGNVVDLCDGPSISSSGLRKIFGESARHYWATSPYNPKQKEESLKEAFTVGRAAHHLLLGEADFKKHFIVRPDELQGEKWHGAKIICKRWKAAREAEGLTILTPEQIEDIAGMAEAIGEDPIAAGMLQGMIEHTLVWQDPGTGIWLKVRPDAVPNDSGDYGDLKTTTDVSEEAIQRTLADFNYPMQGALIGEASERVLGLPMQTFNLVFVEKKSPYAVATTSVWPADLERGAKQNSVALRMFARCLETGKWPGPGGTQSDAKYIAMKSYDVDRADRRVKALEQELTA
jgi:hypothetical protein